MFMSGSAYDQGNVDATERLMVYIAAGDVDVMAGSPLIMDRYAYNDTFRDLRQVLPQEMQDRLSLTTTIWTPPWRQNLTPGRKTAP